MISSFIESADTIVCCFVGVIWNVAQVQAHHCILLKVSYHLQARSHSPNGQVQMFFFLFGGGTPVLRWRYLLDTIEYGDGEYSTKYCSSINIILYGVLSSINGALCTHHH